MKTISSIWNNSTQLKLLIFFMEHPTNEFYGSQVSKFTGISVGAVSKHMVSLCKENLLNKKINGRMAFYSLNTENQIMKHLKIAYNLSKDVIRKLKRIGAELGVEIYLYGSVARGENKESSDWDVLVIGNVSLASIEKKIDDLKNVEIKVSLYTIAEWSKLEKSDPAFYERVEKDNIRLV